MRPGEHWGGAYPDFSYENKTKRFFCGIEPNVVWDVLPVLSVIGSGNWRIIDSGSDSIYWRLDSSDKSHTLIERSCTNFGLSAGVEVRPFTNLAIRIGGGYQRNGLDQTNNSLDLAGGSVFVDANKNHYHEVGWGADPDIDAVSIAVNEGKDTFRFHINSF